MENTNFNLNKKQQTALNAAFMEASKDTTFCKLITSLDINDKIAKKYTSRLEDTTKELKNCSQCKGLYECRNKVGGHVSYPKKDYYDNLIFVSKPCKYYKKGLKEEENKITDSQNNSNARMKDIDITDKKRINLIKWVNKFYDKYEPHQVFKGLYLNGSFGSGKTYILSALFNELKINKKVSTEIVYFPEILRTLKDNWNMYQEKIDYYQNVDLLLIDDIGAEKVTEWGRDEVLGTILQYRMNNGLTTFFTSNLSISDLESHLSITNNNTDMVKARRIIERIKQLTEELTLISENRRK